MADQIPTRANCDLDDPEQRFLWLFVGMNHVVGAMLAFPLDWWRKVSEHLSKMGVFLTCPRCGYEAPEEYVHRLEPGEEPMLGAAGRWVPVEDADGGSDDRLQKTLDDMRTPVKREILRRLRSEFPDDPTLQTMEGDEG